MNKYINYLFVIYAFLLPISRSSISILTALLFVLWLFSNNFKNKIEFLTSNRIIISLLLFVGFSIISLLWSQAPFGGLQYIRKYWYFLTIIVIATAIEKKYLTYAISAFLTGMLISELISYGIFFELWKFKEATAAFPNPFMNHPQYSMFLAFTSLLLLSKIFYEKSLNLKILYVLFFLTTTANLFINAGRTGQVAFAASIFIVGFLHIKNRFFAFFGMSFMLLVIFFASYSISPNFKARVNVGITDIAKVLSKDDYCSSIGLRLAVWQIGGEIFIDNPVLGIGVTNDMEALNESITKKHTNMECAKIMPSYHNFYVQTAVHLGLIGLILYLSVFYNLLKLGIKDEFYSNLLVVFVGIYSISSLVETMFHEQFPAAFFALFTGIFIAQKRIESEV
ncbi:O-antigen ligase family protein [Sulfurimonas sp.]|jgi:O-antigen ligase|uniref:O-antigen ligase family protein n=1 Tax=Sulfurimonas sp. TaxID=2022749 RepID=UPI0025FBBA3A|nr:O-antigen ligase family protein [Sulfurimonas sp.]MCK9473428.1 O-antigen ligase family protein [Sulfurimonas sp.]MDD3505383.1 O-antigen ligase family protein [Sulfurimonas sp.]